MSKLNISILAAAGIIGALPLAALATPVTIQDGYVQAGVSDYGTLGSDSNTSPGILYDATGSGSYGINDFLTPGTPFEGFYLTNALGASWGSNNTAYPTDFGSGSPTQDSTTSAHWSGTSGDGMWTILNEYSLGTISGQSVILINTTLTNNSDSTATGLSFLRTLDPDPDVNAYGSYYTDNVVLSNDQACATGPSTGQTICIYSDSSFTHKAGVSSAWSTNPSDYLSGVNDGNGDYAIGMGFNLGDLASGASTSFSYVYALGADLSTASGGTVPEPGTLLLIGGGLAGLGFARRRKTAA